MAFTPPLTKPRLSFSALASRQLSGRRRATPHHWAPRQPYGWCCRLCRRSRSGRQDETRHRVCRSPPCRQFVRLCQARRQIRVALPARRTRPATLHPPTQHLLRLRCLPLPLSLPTTRLRRNGRSAAVPSGYGWAPTTLQLLISCYPDGQ